MNSNRVYQALIRHSKASSPVITSQRPGRDMPRMTRQPSPQKQSSPQTAERQYTTPFRKPKKFRLKAPTSQSDTHRISWPHTHLKQLGLD
ncbi:unnamed protein product [Tuber aestivum]|uniref:Uncharacterized protein n=1 Tax=Tuber aestivum TaxID=59557 RepID=A0A292PTI1_9PEZI|nr:unnamed protein product [Tuber aestivum]